MKGAFEKSERKGLPGGPNEIFTYTTGVFSTQGYKANSPDVDNPFNIIPSGNITMDGVEFPVHGVDNLGNSSIMLPGNDYEFPGDMVLERPIQDLSLKSNPSRKEVLGYGFAFPETTQGNFIAGAGVNFLPIGTQFGVTGVLPMQSNPVFKGVGTAGVSQQVGNFNIGVGANKDFLNDYETGERLNTTIKPSFNVSYRRRFHDGGEPGHTHPWELQPGEFKSKEDYEAALADYNNKLAEYNKQMQKYKAFQDLTLKYDDPWEWSKKHGATREQIEEYDNEAYLASDDKRFDSVQKEREYLDAWSNALGFKENFLGMKNRLENLVKAGYLSQEEVNEYINFDPNKLTPEAILTIPDNISSYDERRKAIGIPDSPWSIYRERIWDKAKVDAGIPEKYRGVKSSDMPDEYFDAYRSELGRAFGEDEDGNIEFDKSLEYKQLEEQYSKIIGRQDYLDDRYMNRRWITKGPSFDYKTNVVDEEGNSMFENKEDYLNAVLYSKGLIDEKYAPTSWEQSDQYFPEEVEERVQTRYVRDVEDSDIGRIVSGREEEVIDASGNKVTYTYRTPESYEGNIRPVWEMDKPTKDFTKPILLTPEQIAAKEEAFDNEFVVPAEKAFKAKGDLEQQIIQDQYMMENPDMPQGYTLKQGYRDPLYGKTIGDRYVYTGPSSDNKPDIPVGPTLEDYQAWKNRQTPQSGSRTISASFQKGGAYKATSPEDYAYRMKMLSDSSALHQLGEEHYDEFMKAYGDLPTKDNREPGRPYLSPFNMSKRWTPEKQRELFLRYMEWRGENPTFKEFYSQKPGFSNYPDAVNLSTSKVVGDKIVYEEDVRPQISQTVMNMLIDPISYLDTNTPSITSETPLQYDPNLTKEYKRTNTRSDGSTYDEYSYHALNDDPYQVRRYQKPTQEVLPPDDMVNPEDWEKYLPKPTLKKLVPKKSTLSVEEIERRRKAEELRIKKEEELRKQKELETIVSNAEQAYKQLNLLEGELQQDKYMMQNPDIPEGYAIDMQDFHPLFGYYNSQYVYTGPSSDNKPNIPFGKTQADFDKWYKERGQYLEKGERTIKESFQFGGDYIPARDNTAVAGLPSEQDVQNMMIAEQLYNSPEAKAQREQQAYIEREGQIRQYVPPSFGERALAVLANPLTALKHKTTDPNVIKYTDDPMLIDAAIGMVNPFSYVEGFKNAAEGIGNIASGEGTAGDYLNLGLSLLDGWAITKAGKKIVKPLARNYVNKFSNPKEFDRLIEIEKNKALDFTDKWRQPEKSSYLLNKKNLDEVSSDAYDAKLNRRAVEDEYANSVNSRYKTYKDKVSEIEASSVSPDQKSVLLAAEKKNYIDDLNYLDDAHKRDMQRYDEYFAEVDDYAKEVQESMNLKRADSEFDRKAFNIRNQGNVDYSKDDKVGQILDELAGEAPEFPNTRAKTVTIKVDKSKGPQSMYDDPNFKKLSKDRQKYLTDNFNEIGGVNNTEASITFVNEPKLSKVFSLDPAKMKQNFSKEYAKSVEEMGETIVHESAHDSQKYGNWIDRLVEYDNDFGYQVTKGDSPVSRQFQEVLKKPVKPKGSEKYAVQTWEGAASELHSELDLYRYKLINSYIDNGQLSNMDEGIELLKNWEKAGNDDYYKWMADKLKRHWAPDISYDKKKAVLQLLPTAAVLGTVGSGLMEESPLPQQQQGGEPALRDNTYVDIKTPQIYTAPIDNTRVEKTIVPEPVLYEMDLDGLMKGIAQAESLGGVLMINPESSATGLYGQRFSEIEDSYKGSRSDFAKDTAYQKELFKKRFYEGLKDTETTPLQRDAYELYDEYNMQIDSFPYSYEDIAALSNFLGRQGTREYFGYVLRDGKPLEEVFPTKYGAKAEQANKTPEEYLSITRPFYTKSKGGEILKVYADYINGALDNTPMYEKGGRVYDKLNRIYYKDAKEAGMSSPNYIMTYLVNRSS